MLCFNLSENSSKRFTRLGLSVDSAKITSVDVGKKTKRNPPASDCAKKQHSDNEEDSSSSADEGNIIFIPSNLTI